MSDIRKLLDIISETSAGATGAGSVATVSQPMTTQRRVQEQTPASPEVMEYGNWENSALTTSSKLKKGRNRAAKVVKSIYGEDNPGKTVAESSRKKPVLEATGDTGFDNMMNKISATAPQATRSNDAANRIVMNARRLVNSAEFLRIAEQHADKLSSSGSNGIGEITLHTLAALADLAKTKNPAIQESQLEEQDLIINPAALTRKISGLMGKQQDRTDHEVAMAKSDLYQACKNAAAVFDMIKDRSEQEGIEGWVQKKITTAEDYLSTVRDYLEGTKLESMDGVSPGTHMFASEQHVKEGAVKNILADLKDKTMSDADFKKKYDKTRIEARALLQALKGQQGVAEGSLTDKQQSYWDNVAKEKKNEERKALKAEKAKYEKTPAGKAEKYWSKKGVAEGNDWGGPLYDPDLQKGKKKPKLSDVKVKFPSKKTFVVVYYSPKTDRNVTVKVQANNESEVWDKLKLKNIEVVSVKPHGA